MRIWSIHPQYLDTKGILAVWRETLLAKKVLEGKTKGYKNHPQLHRFKAHSKPLDAINFYLQEVHKEAQFRGYNFSKEKFKQVEKVEKLQVTKEQIIYEFNHLKDKLKIRDTNKFKETSSEKEIKIHPLFIQIEGKIESWEKLSK